jgi:protein-disulfide isomerase
MNGHCENGHFKLANGFLWVVPHAHSGAEPLITSRIVIATVLSLAGLVALATFTPDSLVGAAKAQSPDAVPAAKPESLPDIALGPATAPVTIIEYASMTCPHCAAFEQNVFPMLKSKYIDTGKVRFVFREFPLDIKAVAASMLARCVAGGDPEKYFGTVQLLFKQQDQLVAQTTDTLKLIGAQAGLNQQAVEACVKDQALLDKLSAGQNLAFNESKVEVTPTFFINGEMSKGAMTFEELDKKIRSLLKK